jgi:hypothetical protein
MKGRSDQATDVARTNVEGNKFSDDVQKVCILLDNAASARCVKDLPTRVARSEPFRTALVWASNQECRSFLTPNININT